MSVDNLLEKLDGIASTTEANLIPLRIGESGKISVVAGKYRYKGGWPLNLAGRRPGRIPPGLLNQNLGRWPSTRLTRHSRPRLSIKE